MPGMPSGQQAPRQRFSSDVPELGAQYLVGTHGSYHFGNLPKPPTSSFPNLFETHLRGPVEPRTIPHTIHSSSAVPLGSSSIFRPSSPIGDHHMHDGYYSPLGSDSQHGFDAHTPLRRLSLSPPHSRVLAMSRHLDSPMHRASPGLVQYGYRSSMDIDSGSSSSRESQTLPFEDTSIVSQLCDGLQRSIIPEIHAKIDKGFFKADQDWTCYRRNYFAVACSYDLKYDDGHEVSGPVTIRKYGTIRPVEKFAVCITACVDADEGKPVELVQHTPKRDKGPMGPPVKKILKPNPSGHLGSLGSSSVGSYAPSASIYQQGQDSARRYPGSTMPSPPPPPLSDDQTRTTFERIQFKKATANNGKRRAAQQYFHIVVELYGGIRKTQAAGNLAPMVEELEWHKIAARLSAQMVVRGRSPGHYNDERRTSTSMGPGSGMGGPDTGPGGGYYGASGTAHPAMSGSAYPATDRLGSSGGYSTRGIMHMNDAIELVPSLSSCSTLDDSSISGDGSATMSTNMHSPYSMYASGGGMSQVTNSLMSPAFSLTSSVARLNTPRAQIPASSSFVKNSPSQTYGSVHRLDHKLDQEWFRRTQPHCMPDIMGHRYDPIVNHRPSSWLGGANDPSSLGEHRAWQTLPREGTRMNWEHPMPAI